MIALLREIEKTEFQIYPVKGRPRAIFTDDGLSQAEFNEKMKAALDEGLLNLAGRYDFDERVTLTEKGELYLYKKAIESMRNDDFFLKRLLVEIYFRGGNLTWGEGDDSLARNLGLTLEKTIQLLELAEERFFLDVMADGKTFFVTWPGCAFLRDEVY